MLWATARSLVVATLLDTRRVVATMRTQLDLKLVRAAIGVMVYFAILDLVTIAAYALWAGPQRFGISEPLPLVFYFVVPYVETTLIAAGIVAVVRAHPGIVHRVMSQHR